MSDGFEHIVIGGGISGLGLAHWVAAKGLQTLVLEAGGQVGGCINSQTFPDRGGFWVEAGSHTCYNSYGHLLDILADLGLLGRLTPKTKVSYALWRGGRGQSILSALHPLELLLSLPRLFTASKAGLSVRDYYAAGLGVRNYRDLFGPAFRAVICQDADDFPADLLFRRKPRRKEILRSFTFPQGLAEIPRAIAAQSKLEVRTGHQVNRIDRDGTGFRLSLAQGDSLYAATLGLAVPPDVAARLLGPLLPVAAWEAIDGIGMQEIETLVLCLPAHAVSHLRPTAGLISVDDAFNAMVSRDYLVDQASRGFSFHFRPGGLGEEEQLDRACAVLGVRPADLAGLVRVRNRLPALRVGHAERVGRIDQALAGTQIAITGNWFQGVSLEDCLTRSQAECERLFD